MKKLISLLLLFCAVHLGAQTVNVTFQVDMNNYTGTFTTPELNGTFNNWCGNCSAMSDSNGDGIWDVTVALTPGDTIEYKFSHDSWTGQETNDPTASCTNGNAQYTNRVLIVPSVATTLPVVCWGSCDPCGTSSSTVNVTFQVDMNNYTGTFTTPELNGTFNNWCGNCSAMSDSNGDGIWDVTVALTPGDTIEYKFSHDSWTGQETNDPTASCTNGNAQYTNRVLIVPSVATTLPVVCWGSCDPCIYAPVNVTFQVDMNNYTGTFTTPELNGTFNNWCGNCSAMSDSNGDGIWDVTVALTPGDSILYMFSHDSWTGYETLDPTASCTIEISGNTHRVLTVPSVATTLPVVCWGSCDTCGTSSFTPTCPVTDTLTIASQTSCGASPVTFTTAATSSTNTVLWMNADSAVVGMGNSFTTPVITTNTDYYAAVYADNNLMGAVHVGPPTTLTGGFGNFTNGMWFSVLKPMTIDSISVISNGLVNFQVRISEGGGNKTSGHSGAELMRSDTISVGVAGTHQVPVNLTLTPGVYYMNMAFLGGTTGQLHRATAGGAYPYQVVGVMGLDSVQFGATGTNPRVYYAYDWVVSEGCTGPVSTASAIAGAAPSTSFPYQVDFNNGIPCNWTTDGTTQDWSPVSSYGSSTIDGTAFVIFDDDAAGSSAAPVNVSLISPEIDATGYDTISLEFDHYWNSYPGTTGYVEVWDGSNWNVIDNLTTTRGSWSSPVHETYNITAYQNANLKVRLRYSDGSGTWGWYWAVDNIKIDGTLSPCTPVRVEVITDIYGSEVSWYIKDINTGITWLSGGPYADVSPYNISAATHIDTICLPNSGTYEFRINDSYGDGMDDGTNAGWFSVDVLCPNGLNNIIQIDTSLTSLYGAPWGPFHYGNTTNPPMYDSAVFTTSCTQYSNVTFQVDMSQVQQSFTTPEVNGFWNNWCGNCNAMSDPEGDNIWTVTLPLEVGSYQEFKYSADGWSIQEMNDPTASCTNGNTVYTNRVLTVPASDTTLPVVCWSSCDACAIICSGTLNGIYTINNDSATGGTNFNSFTDAISALGVCGISGPVVFNVKQGTYTEQVTIPSVTGASASNSITFQADPTNTSDAIVTYSPTGTSDNWTVRLNGCNDVAIKGLVITSGGTSYGRLLNYTGNVTNISLLDNTFNGVAGTSTSSYFAGIYYTSPTEAKGVWHVEGNTMNNISYGVYVYGSSYTTSMDSIFIENNVINTTYYGLYPRYAKYQKVHGNTVNALGSYAYNYLYYPSYGIDVQNNTMNCGTGYGFYVYSAPSGGSDMFAIVENNTINAGTYGIRVGGSATSTYNHFSDVTIKKNNITLTGSTNYGIYLYAVDGNGATVENNMIASAGTGSVYGIYSYHSGGVAYQHNTVNVTAGSATAGRACYFNASTSTSSFTADSNTVNNNIFVNSGGGYAFEASSSAPAGTHFTSDYNNFYATSTTPFGSGSSTLSAWQTASSQDANSVWGDPLFVSATDLHVQGAAPNNAGTALGVLTDIDGDTRSTTTPDMGADEYVPLTCFGVSGLGAANISDVSFDATWSSNNSTTIGSQVRYRLNGSTGAYTVLTGSTGTATISGLMASTSYDYSVREICSLGDTCSWSADATVTTAACALSNQCQYTVYLIDSYGDGWNGNVVTFTQSGNVNASVTLPSGSLDTAYVGLVFMGFRERGFGNTRLMEL